MTGAPVTDDIVRLTSEVPNMSEEHAISFNYILKTGQILRQGTDPNDPDPNVVQRLNVEDTSNPFIQQIDSIRDGIVRDVKSDTPSTDSKIAALQALYKKDSWDMNDRVAWEKNLTELVSDRVTTDLKLGDYRNAADTKKYGNIVPLSDLTQLQEDEGSLKQHEWDCKAQSAVKGVIIQMAENNLLPPAARPGSEKSAGTYYEMNGEMQQDASGPGGHAYVASSRTGNIFEATNGLYKNNLHQTPGPDAFRSLTVGAADDYSAGLDVTVYGAGSHSDGGMNNAFNNASHDPAYITHSAEWLAGTLACGSGPSLGTCEDHFKRLTAVAQGSPDPDGRAQAGLNKLGQAIGANALKQQDALTAELNGYSAKGQHANAPQYYIAQAGQLTRFNQYMDPAASQSSSASFRTALSHNIRDYVLSEPDGMASLQKYGQWLQPDDRAMIPALNGGQQVANSPTGAPPPSGNTVSPVSPPQGQSVGVASATAATQVVDLANGYTNGNLQWISQHPGDYYGKDAIQSNVAQLRRAYDANSPAMDDAGRQKAQTAIDDYQAKVLQASAHSVADQLANNANPNLSYYQARLNEFKDMTQSSPAGARNAQGDINLLEATIKTKATGQIADLANQSQNHALKWMADENAAHGPGNYYGEKPIGDIVNTLENQYKANSPYMDDAGRQQALAAITACKTNVLQASAQSVTDQLTQMPTPDFPWFQARLDELTRTARQEPAVAGAAQNSLDSLASALGSRAINVQNNMTEKLNGFTAKNQYASDPQPLIDEANQLSRCMTSLSPADRDAFAASSAAFRTALSHNIRELIQESKNDPVTIQKYGRYLEGPDRAGIPLQQLSMEDSQRTPRVPTEGATIVSNANGALVASLDGLPITPSPDIPADAARTYASKAPAA